MPEQRELGRGTWVRASLGVDDASRGPVNEIQRLRILSSMVEVCCERGINHAAVTQIVSRAGVSRGTFYELFDDRYECFLAVFDEAVALARSKVVPAYQAERRWVDSLRAGLWTMLLFFEENPELARVCVVESLAGDWTILTRRLEVLDSIAAIVDLGRAFKVGAPPGPLTAEAAVGGAFAVIHRRLMRAGSSRLLDLVNPLMAMLVLPYLGSGSTRRELARPVAKPRLARKKPPSTRGLLGLPSMRLTNRTVHVLAAIAAKPGASNRQIADDAGIADAGQISKLLGRLCGLALIQNSEDGQPRRRANAWKLTTQGQRFLLSVQADHAFARPGVERG